MVLGTITARFFHQMPWEYLWIYRWLLVSLRLAELSIIVMRYFLIYVPLQWIGLRKKNIELAPGGDVLIKGTPISGIGMVAEGDGRVKGGHAILRVLMEELGPSFIKVAQLISMRPEMPEELRGEFGKIQEKVPTMSFAQVRKTVEKELGKPLEEVFSYFEEKPIGSASLAQVHRAVLRAEGLECAVKVQRPYLAAVTQLDTMIMNSFYVVLRTFLPSLRRKTDANIFMVGFAAALKRELDFYLEARYQEKFTGLLSLDPIFSKHVKVAQVYWGYTTNKVLVMELLKGLVRTDTVEAGEIFRDTRIDAGQYKNMSQYGLLFLVGDLCVHMVCRWGFCHGDFHGGNMYVTTDGKLALVDFGMCEAITEEQRERMEQWFIDMLFYSDHRKIADDILIMHVRDAGGKPEDIDYENLRLTVQRTVDSISGIASPDKIYSMPNVICRCFYVLATCGVKFPPFWWLFVKTLFYMEEYFDRYMPGMDFRDVVCTVTAPAIKDRLLRRLDSMNVISVRDRAIEEVLMPAYRPMVADTPKYAVARWGYLERELDMDNVKGALSPAFRKNNPSPETECAFRPLDEIENNR